MLYEQFIPIKLFAKLGPGQDLEHRPSFAKLRSMPANELSAESTQFPTILTFSQYILFPVYYILFL